MVVVSKADRSIKVTNLPENISNDVLGFIFSESINVERKPFATTATVEFGSVRDVENYIRRDKTLMIENKVLAIEGCSTKNEEPSNEVPFEEDLDWAHQRKLEKYEDLQEQCVRNGWITDVFPIEVGCRGFITKSTLTFFTKLGLSLPDKRKYIKKIRDKALTTSAWIWQSYKTVLVKISVKLPSLTAQNTVDPLECRQLYIENLPRSTTTEYLDVLFPFAKSIKRLNGCSALAEYRTTKDAEFELIKSKSLRIDRHQLSVRLAKECHRFGGGGGGHNSHDRHEKGHSSSDRSSFSNTERSDKKKTSVDNNDLLFSGKEILSDLYGLPVEFGRSSSSRQRKDNSQDVWSKKQSVQSSKKELPNNSASASSTASSASCSRASRSDTGRTKHEGSESKKESSSHSSKESDAKSNRHSSRPVEPERSEKHPGNISRQNKPFTSCNLVWNSKTAMASKAKNTDSLPGTSGSSSYTSRRSTDNPVKRRSSQEEHNADKTKHPRGNYSSDNRRHESQTRSNEEILMREYFEDRAGERRVRNNEDRKNFERNRGSIDRERLNERDRQDERRKTPRKDPWREDNKLADSLESGRRASCERFGSRVDDHENQRSGSAYPEADKQYLGHRSEAYGSERNIYRDDSVFNSRSATDKMRYNYQDPDFSQRTSSYEKFPSGDNVDERMFNRGNAGGRGRTGWGENQDQGMFSSNAHQNTRWSKDNRRLDQGGQNRIPNAEFESHGKDPFMDRGRFDERSNANLDSLDRYPNRDRNVRGRFGNDPADMDPERFNQGPSMSQEEFMSSNKSGGRFNKDPYTDQDRFNQSSVIDERKFDRGPNMDRRKFDRGSNVDNTVMNQERFSMDSNVDQVRFDRSSNIDRERFGEHSRMDEGRFDRGQNMDRERFDRGPNLDRERFGGHSSMDQGKFDRDSNMDQGRFDRGSNGDCRRFMPATDQSMSDGSLSIERDGYMNNKRFNRDPNMDQEKCEQGSKADQNRFNRELRRDQNRFKEDSSVDPNTFEGGSNQDQNQFYRGQNREHNRFGRDSNMDQNRCNVGPNIDQNRFDKGLYTDQNRFDRFPNQDQNRFSTDQGTSQNRFDRSVGMDQGRFDKGSNMDPNRLGWDPNMDRNRFNRGPNMDQNRFDSDPNVNYNNLGNNYSGMNPNRPGDDPNADRFGFPKDPPSRNQNRYDHGANADHRGSFGNNNTGTGQLGKTWKSADDQRFVKVNNDKQGRFRDNLNIDPSQCWSGPNTDNVQDRREIQAHGGPEKRTFSDMETGNHWRNNMAVRNFRHENHEESQDFPSKKLRKDGSYNNNNNNNGGGGYFNNNANSSCGQNKQLMDSYAFHAPPLHLPPPPLSSSRPQMMQSLMSVTPPNHLVTSHRL